jgi:hypothetical protein
MLASCVVHTINQVMLGGNGGEAQHPFLVVLPQLRFRLLFNIVATNWRLLNLV